MGLSEISFLLTILSIAVAQRTFPKIVEGPGDVVAVANSEVVLRCRVVGSPAPKVTWTKDREIVAHNYILPLTSSLMTPEGDLKLLRATYSDAGTYTCHAGNLYGEVSKTGTLVIKHRTRITERPKSQLVRVGSTVEFRCAAFGDYSLERTISWLFNDEPIDFVNNPRLQKATDDSLMIKDATEDDSGEYTCVAKTGIDEVRAKAILTVEGVPVKITEGPGNVVVVDGSDVVLHCRAEGSPPLTFTWERNGRVVSSYRARVSSGGDLLIRGARLGDAGTYTCVVNGRRSRAEESGTLEIKQRTIITNKPADQRVRVGSYVTLRCNAHYDYSLTLVTSWLRSGLPLSLDSRVRKGADNSLVISSATEDDSGEYTCLATTAIDEAQAHATLTVIP